MFDIGWSELVVIGVVALIVIGPKELPTVLRTVGQWMGKARRMASEFQGQFQEAMREAEIADLKKQFDEAASVASDMTKYDPLAATKKEIEDTFAASNATPAAAAEPALPAETDNPAIAAPSAESAASMPQDLQAPAALPDAPQPASEPLRLDQGVRDQDPRDQDLHDQNLRDKELVAAPGRPKDSGT